MFNIAFINKLSLVIMKKYLKFGLIAFAFVILGVASVKVLAQSSSGPGGGGPISPMIINIGPNGNVLMRGIVVGAPGANSFVIKSWGGSWTTNVSAATQLITLNRVITDLQDGDFVGVLGTISSDGTFTVDARIVREWRGKLDVNDADKDGIPNEQDLDDDNDGVLDVSDSKPNDHDNDNISDDLDADDDNDGKEDDKDSRHGDHDNDGIKDSRDSDDDNDGLPDVSDRKPHNHDNDDKDDDEDEDDDNDGKDDNSDSDDDNDGIDDSSGRGEDDD